MQFFSPSRVVCCKSHQIDCHIDLVEADAPEIGSCTLTDLCDYAPSATLEEDDNVEGDDETAVSGVDGDGDPVEVCSIELAACQVPVVCCCLLLLFSAVVLLTVTVVALGGVGVVVHQGLL